MNRLDRLLFALLPLLVFAPAVDARTGDAEETRVARRISDTILVPSGDPDVDRRYFGDEIDLSLRDADLPEVLRSFARMGDFNLVLQPSVRGKVTVELKKVPWDQAMDVILRMHGLGLDVTQAEPEGRAIVRIAPIAELERLLREERRPRDDR